MGRGYRGLSTPSTCFAAASSATTCGARPTTRSSSSTPRGVRPALAPGDRVCWASVPGEFEVVLVEDVQAVVRSCYANHTQRLYVVNRSDLRQAPPAPPEAVQPQPEEVR
jgi:hypothetical protein